MPSRLRKDDADEAPLAMDNKTLDRALEKRLEILMRNVEERLGAIVERVMEDKLATTLAKLKAEVLGEVEDRLTEAYTTVEERLSTFDKRAEEVTTTVTTYSETVKKNGAVAEAAQAQVGHLKARVKAVEERLAASRMRDLRITFTQAAGGTTQEEAQAFARGVLLDKGKYGSSAAEQLTVLNIYAFPFKTSGQGYPGQVEVPNSAPCWAMVVQVNTTATASRLLRLQDLKGTDLFIQVNRDLSPEERKHRQIIRDSPAFRKARDAFTATPGRFPKWILDRVELARGDWWDVSRVQAEQGTP
jgi:uncharacterized coiled-coil protein SlyX